MPEGQYIDIRNQPLEMVSYWLCCQQATAKIAISGYISVVTIMYPSISILCFEFCIFAHRQQRHSRLLHRAKGQQLSYSVDQAQRQHLQNLHRRYVRTGRNESIMAGRVAPNTPNTRGGTWLIKWLNDKFPSLVAIIYIQWIGSMAGRVFLHA